MTIKSFFIYLSFLLAAVFSSFVSIHLLMPRFVWINESLHSTAEAFGSLAAIFIAIMLLHRKHEEGGGRRFWMAIGLLSMGLLHGFHSAARLGHGFVLLHSVACLSGGFWFAFVWLPEPDSFSPVRKWTPWLVAVGSILLGVWILLFRETMPLMIEDGKFTLTAILTNLLAGVFFLAATGRFLLDFLRSGKIELFFFSFMALLFGLANLSFPFSVVWDTTWWFWHLHRVLAYILALWVVFKNDQQMISTFKSTIIERDRSEESLRETNEFLENLFNYANAPIIVWDPQFRITRFNHAFESLTGRNAADVAGKSLDLLFPPSLVESSMELIQKTLRGERWETVEISILHVDGSVRTVLWNSSTLFASDGKTPVATIAQGHDVTERKQAEESLKESEERYRRITDAITDYIYTVRMEKGKHVETVHGVACFAVTGYTGEEFAADPYLWFRMVFEDDRNLVHKQAEEVLSGHSPQSIEHRIIRKDGIERWVESIIVPLYDINNNLISYDGIVHDITERKNLENQLLHSQKMEAVGQLAGGIAHDFNNIMSAIINYAYLIKNTMKEDDPLRAQIEQISSLSMKASEITRGLLAFSRKHIICLIPLHINKVLHDMGKLLSKFIGEDVQFNSRLSDKDPVIMADSANIEQVIINLATNASDAMPEGGSLTIETDLVIIDDAFICMHGFGKRGTYALLSVTDTGIGIDEETKQRIFEPFFTTKEVGKGTGLGLAIVYGIVKQHKGYMNVYSEPGGGTTFKIYFPISRAAVPEKEETKPSDLTGHAETILVAEDEETVRNSIKIILEQFGYKAIEAVNGDDAIEKYREHKDKIALLLFDVIMPKKNGKEAYEEIKKITPGIKVIFTSGYSADIIDKKNIITHGFAYISKPLSPDKLLSTIKEVLQNGKESPQ